MLIFCGFFFLSHKSFPFSLAISSRCFRLENPPFHRTTMSIQRSQRTPFRFHLSLILSSAVLPPSCIDAAFPAFSRRHSPGYPLSQKPALFLCVGSQPAHQFWPKDVIPFLLYSSGNTTAHETPPCLAPLLKKRHKPMPPRPVLTFANKTAAAYPHLQTLQFCPTSTYCFIGLSTQDNGSLAQSAHGEKFSDLEA